MNLYPVSDWRLLRDGPGDGAWNMAVDEAILGTVAGGAAPPTLRLYEWNPPCLSLGRSQLNATVDAQACQDAGISCVRRATGGRAILHRDELTYSICLPLSDPRAAGDILESYRRLSAGLAAGLRLLGIAVEQAPPRETNVRGSAACFDAAAGHEITFEDRKLLGSAQYRARNTLLQHGSLPLRGDIAGVVDFLTLDAAEKEILRARLRATAITLSEALRRQVSPQEAGDALCMGISQALNVRFSNGHLSPAEIEAAQVLQEQKYAFWDRMPTGTHRTACGQRSNS